MPLKKLENFRELTLPDPYLRLNIKLQKSRLYSIGIKIDGSVKQKREFRNIPTCT